MHHEQYDKSMKARPQRRRRETGTLVEQAERVLCESRKLLEQREAQLEQLEQFLEQNPGIVRNRRQSNESRMEFGLGRCRRPRRTNGLDC